MEKISPLPKSSSSKRAVTQVLTPTELTTSFVIVPAQKTYKHQYSNIYFTRLRHFRDLVEQRARKRWEDLDGNPVLVPRVLEVLKSQLCYIVGTVYMDMPLKPNVMEDIARDRSIPPPPLPSKFWSPDDKVMLEDESGRIRLVGDCVKKAKLVTGVILGALGMETPNGEFEVVDICYPGMAPNPIEEESGDKMNVDASEETDEWIAAVSGLDVGSPSSSDARIHMLIEYLTGEECGTRYGVSPSQISRIIIAGNSVIPISVSEKADVDIKEKKTNKYSYDSTSFSAHPIMGISAHLLDIARAMPVHLLPGENDPSGVILPQQALPKAMFGGAASLSSFNCETNPTYLRLGNEKFSRTLLVNSGQPLNDMFKYVSCPPHTRLSLLESTLIWRHMAPTAPDTLWCHPYLGVDPFIIKETPDIYIVGGQQRLITKMVSEKDGRCRIIGVPSFADTGVLVLINIRTLKVRKITFETAGMGVPTVNGAAEVDAPSNSPSMEQLESSLPHSSNDSTFH
ncbi:DNA polymerase subunit delta-2 [Moniliophthora roreri MCA 2997]|uniref:DNA-directed DNA polymerase n=2 Tax=Moniliophthora roreri TaxID=221103 RepID=V2WGB3_MONRO|nr:DNA polymerase subunit delta-2 [Moniliophthora roreri MCA 2997]